MKNMKKGRLFLSKLKTNSTPTWNSTLVFQPGTPTSNPHKEDNRHSLPTLNGVNFSISETSMNVKQEALTSFPNADKSAHSSAVSMRDHVEDHSPLSRFVQRCPPGGKDSVVLYTTSLRGIRKTFEDCNTIRFLLESFRVVYSERDVSMHLEYREELWKILDGRVVPPKVFIRGRYIGGADEVVGLHEKGMLKRLLEGIPLSPFRNPCKGCGGVRFMLCCSCSGSRKVVPEGQDEGVSSRCPDCNENGLVKCTICSIL